MLRVVRLGSPRRSDEGLRLGTVRRPPRGVPKSEYAAQDWYDVWLPDLAPSAELVKLAHAATTERQWATYDKKYRAEMKAPEKARLLDLLAAMSHQTSFSVGCYCEDETRCHRSILRQLLEERGADVGGYRRIDESRPESRRASASARSRRRTPPSPSAPRR